MKSFENKAILISIVISAFLAFPLNAYAMHIMEGFLPPEWCISWGVLCIPFIVKGIFVIKKKVSGSSKRLLILAMCGAFAFVLSALKLPSVTGSSSHATGMGLGTVIFGPFTMAIIGLIVLVFQALLLAHGGLTTLGANTFSMAIAGPFIAFGVFILCKKFKVNVSLSVFLAAFIASISTYIITSFQLSLAFPDATMGVGASFIKFLGIFALTQLPIAVAEGLITTIAYSGIKKYGENELEELAYNGRGV